MKVTIIEDNKIIKQLQNELLLKNEEKNNLQSILNQATDK